MMEHVNEEPQMRKANERNQERNQEEKVRRETERKVKTWKRSL